jgi:hypothetical protein
MEWPGWPDGRASLACNLGVLGLVLVMEGWHCVYESLYAYKKGYF